MATSEETKTKIRQVNSLLDTFLCFEKPNWSRWYYSYLLDTYVKNVALQIESALNKKTTLSY